MFKQQQVSDERYAIISTRYKKFLEIVNDPTQPPVVVFDPLSPKQVQELDLIREVSKQLQTKKEDDMKKAAQAKEEAKKIAEEKKEVKEEAAVVQEETEKEETKKEE